MSNMQIFVDADACPVVGIVEAVAAMALGKGYAFVARQQHMRI